MLSHEMMDGDHFWIFNFGFRNLHVFFVISSEPSFYLHIIAKLRKWYEILILPNGVYY